MDTNQKQELNQQQELINHITEIVTNNVLETVKKWLDDEKQTEQEDTTKDVEKAKETIKSVMRK